MTDNDNKLDKSRKLRSILWAIAMLMLTTVGIGVMTAVALVVFGQSYWTLMIMQGASSIGIFLLSAFIAVYISERKICGSDSDWHFDIVTAICCIVLVLLCQPLVEWASYVNEWICKQPYMEWAKVFDIDQTDIMATLMSFEPVSHYIMCIVVIAILPAICEEFFFRGVILRGLTATMHSVSGAVVVSAIFFSMLHLDIEGFLPRVVLGIILGFLYLKTRSLLYPIIAHATNNAMVVIVTASSDESVKDILSKEAENPGPAMPILSLAVTLWICWMISQRYQNAKAEEKSDNQD